eukprot:GILK01020936.1.p1 GENE.GILK01020936.1~~GILK01020936.1.p1  ORF type:complete len:411 (+),score=51.77 GILK01020936.1:102-1235(+)
MDNSLFQIDRGVRSVGAALEHLEVNKKYTGMRVDARGDMWQNPTTNLFTCVSAPRFHEADIERFRDTMDALLEEQRWQQPRDYCVDQLETIAFHKETLGNPRRVPVTANDACSSKRLLDHWAKHATPDRVIISGVNVDHQALVKAYEDAPFPHSSSAPHHSRSDKNFADQTNEATTYQGGNENHEQENRAKEIGQKPDCEAETIAAIGYKTFGRDVSVKDYAAALVAQQAMNLIVKDAIRYEREDTHHGIRTFYRPYSSTGLFGFTVRGTEEEALRQVQRTIDVLNAFKPTEQQRAFAISRAVVRLFHNELERTSDFADFLATSAQSPEEVEAALKAVSLEQVDKALKTLTRSQPAAFTTGDAHAWPSIKQFGWSKQ